MIWWCYDSCCCDNNIRSWFNSRVSYYLSVIIISYRILSLFNIILYYYLILYLYNSMYDYLFNFELEYQRWTVSHAIINISAIFIALLIFNLIFYCVFFIFLPFIEIGCKWWIRCWRFSLYRILIAEYSGNNQQYWIRLDFLSLI